MKKKYLWGLTAACFFAILTIILILYSQNNPKRRDTRLSKNENHLYAIAKKISIYYLSNGKLPADLPTLIEKGWLSKKDIIDDWNSKENIKYIPLKGLEFKLRTTGPDRKFNPNGPILKVRDLSEFIFEDKIVTGDIEVTYSVVTIENTHVLVNWSQNSFYDW